MALSACGADDRPANWGYVYQAIIKPNCATASCHTGGNAVGGINLETPSAAYAILTGSVCVPDESPASQNFVVPGYPTGSRLLYLLLGDDVARSMPPDRLLPLQDVELVEEWIAEGALCD
jgi:hypothetical protein